MSANDDLTAEQIEQLSKVFRAEAIEHIKGIAEVLFSAEDGALTDVTDGVNRAFREAHSLKGSAGTLGFNRVAIMAHRFEDALGTLKSENIELSPKRLEILLQALETIRQAVFSQTPGDSDLTEREYVTMKQIQANFPLTADDTNIPVSPRRVTSPDPASTETIPDDSQSNEAPATGTVATKLSSSPQVQSAAAPEAKQELIRVSETRIDEVITQFGELFETSLQLESLGHDLDTNNHEANRLTDGLSELLSRMEGTAHEAEIMELVDMARNLTILSKSAGNKFEFNQRELNKHIQRSQEALRQLRIAPISSLHLTIRNQVRETSNRTGKKVQLSLAGGEYAVDRAILDAIEKPLIHLIRNAVDHGIEPPAIRRGNGKNETGTLTIEGRHLGDAVELHIADDGGGLNADAIRKKLTESYNMSQETAAKLTEAQLFDYLFEAGFSTSKQVSQISGRGVGLDVVKYTIEHLGGEVSVQSKWGQGTRFILRLPLTMSSIKCLLLEAAGQTMAVPASNISRVLVLGDNDVKKVGGGDVVVVDDAQISLTTFEEILGTHTDGSAPKRSDSKFAAIIRFGARRYAFGFDRIFEYTQLVIKPLGDLLERVPNVSGLALLGTGKLCLVLNPSDLIRSASGTIAKPSVAKAPPKKRVTTILVVDDSIAIRTMQQTLLESAGFQVLLATDGLQALQTLGNHRVDLVISDVQMPNMGGFELAQAIKSRDKTRSIPVILVTSLGSPEDIRAGMEAGADAHIVKKELTRTELLSTIEQLL
ncbi:MAG: response regulator [Deltaproteobacteria bacterium]|nr:response regulator [Deltaproteobacteria bacterium]MBN2672729.1 response regulator [Deltaproteobacteria bacterium]